ncbi:porin-like protein [Plasticicumulans lactativorans]|uniref:Porin-like protein n=2 Tax=Plasticicumulans lactativorans TaxID=1133106 RepID=A0A4R2L8Q1_9GAMM|nr:porin [Plasticicumulans lactativorans]TCO82452.1 porin-like protein [Plasticicumulans lactativorans]
MANRNADTDLVGVDLRYGTPDFQIGGTYEHGDLTLLGGLPASLTGGIEGVFNPVKGMNSTGWGIAGQYNLGNNVLLAHGGRRTSDYAFTELNEYALGVQHWFSKRTHAYVEYEYIDRKSDLLNDNSTVAIGLRTDF